MRDLLPADTWLWERVEKEYRRVMALYNYREIRIPVLEKTVLFARSIGEETDIVKKEMYTFTDAGGEELSLRPEGTAGVVRAYIQHSIHVQEPVSKLYYIGPMFRRERPQKGRYRQFYQAGSEIFGVPEPLPEIEQVLMLNDFFEVVGLDDVTFVCNHLGTPESREEYTGLLVSFFKKYRDGLCEDCRRRLETNPLRILDCKQEECGEIIARSPSFEECRPESSTREFRKFAGTLQDMSVSIKIEPRLVRGLDYYTGIVFEGITGGGGKDTSLAIVGGGRYDALVRQLGGQAKPAVGYAIGMERLVDICREKMGSEAGPDIFIAVIGSEQERFSLKLLHDLRGQGWRCDFDPRMGSLKRQMKMADKVSARFVLIVGEEEIKQRNLKLRDMVSGEQSEVRIDEVEKVLKEKLG